MTSPESLQQLQSFTLFLIVVLTLGNLPVVLNLTGNFRNTGNGNRNEATSNSNNDKQQYVWSRLSNGQWVKNNASQSTGSISNQLQHSLEVSDDDLRQLSEHLLSIDNNNVAKLISANYQGVTTSRSQNDEAPLPLITTTDDVYKFPTIKALKALYDNYVPQTNVAEIVTDHEKREENELLNLIVTTPVMEYARNFLIQKGKLEKNIQEFKNLLQLIWFDMYPRGSGKISSCGFEHVFMAEIKKGTVSGLHNWLYFKEEEAKGKVNYLGFMKKILLSDKGAILKHHSTFSGIDKPVGSMFMGTSPELEIALYSVCFVLRADKICPLKMDGKRFIIRTYTYRYKGKNMLGSAFPEI